MGTPIEKVFAKYRDKLAAADPTERSVLPPGEYTAVLERGEFTTSRGGTDGYKLSFRVADGDHAGKPFWHDLWFTDRAMPYTKAAFLKLDFDPFAAPAPRVRCRCKLSKRASDAGAEYNRVESFDVFGPDAPPPSPFPMKPPAPAPAPKAKKGGQS